MISLHGESEGIRARQCDTPTRHFVLIAVTHLTFQCPEEILANGDEYTSYPSSYLWRAIWPKWYGIRLPNGSQRILSPRPQLPKPIIQADLQLEGNEHSWSNLVKAVVSRNGEFEIVTDESSSRQP